METINDDLEKFDKIIKTFMSDNGILESEKKEIRDWFSDVTFKLEDIRHDLSQNRVIFDNNENKNLDKFEAVDVMPFNAIEKQISSNYNEI